MFSLALLLIKQLTILANGIKEDKQRSDHQPDRQDLRQGVFPRPGVPGWAAVPDTGQAAECQLQADEVGWGPAWTAEPPTQGDIRPLGR